MKSPVVARVVTGILAAVVGAVFGVAGTIGHAYRWGWIPVGLVVAVIGAGALLLAVRALTGDRWATLATGIGMLAAIVLFSGRGPGGSVIVPSDEGAMLGPVNLGFVWTFAVPILMVFIVGWPRRAEPTGESA